MRIRIKGEHSITAIKQVLFELLTKAECDHGVRYTIDATLYIRPSNGFGREFTPSYPNGRPIQYLYSNGPYRSAADDYDCN
ncbi:MAG: hypothetical protein MI743_12990 [Sneathiellales bacterium]|nr:hypothetical protein [Sneathiellales bacterium]